MTKSSRRAFVKGLAMTGMAASVGVLRGAAASAQSPPATGPAVLTGSEFDLRIGTSTANLTGRSRTALTINGSLPGPTLRWREGDTVTLRVANALDEDTSIHWHGILLPANMDGVPGLSFDGIHPGQTYTYRFTVRQNGTYWYHSHSASRSSTASTGRSSSSRASRNRSSTTASTCVMLTDWTDEDPARVFAKLKKQSDYYNFRQRTVGDFVRDVRRDGLGATLASGGAWGEMRMSAGRPRRRHRLHLHLPDERPAAGRQLDGPVHAGRARAAAVHQRLGDVVLRCADPRA